MRPENQHYSGRGPLALPTVTWWVMSGLTSPGSRPFFNSTDLCLSQLSSSKVFPTCRTEQDEGNGEPAYRPVLFRPEAGRRSGGLRVSTFTHRVTISHSEGGAQVTRLAFKAYGYQARSPKI